MDSHEGRRGRGGEASVQDPPVRAAVFEADWLLAQGNFNADNCLVGGRTMDYGPFGWMDEWDPLFAKCAAPPLPLPLPASATVLLLLLLLLVFPWVASGHRSGASPTDDGCAAVPPCGGCAAPGGRARGATLRSRTSPAPAWPTSTPWLSPWRRSWTAGRRPQTRLWRQQRQRCRCVPESRLLRISGRCRSCSA